MDWFSGARSLVGATGGPVIPGIITGALLGGCLTLAFLWSKVEKGLFKRIVVQSFILGTLSVLADMLVDYTHHGKLDDAGDYILSFGQTARSVCISNLLHTKVEITKYPWLANAFLTGGIVAFAGLLGLVIEAITRMISGNPMSASEFAEAFSAIALDTISAMGISLVSTGMMVDYADNVLAKSVLEPLLPFAVFGYRVLAKSIHELLFP